MLCCLLHACCVIVQHDFNSSHTSRDVRAKLNSTITNTYVCRAGPVDHTDMHMTYATVKIILLCHIPGLFCSSVSPKESNASLILKYTCSVECLVCILAFLVMC